MKAKGILFFIFLLFLVSMSYADDFVPKHKKGSTAMLLSICTPGGGQWYTDHYSKAILIGVADLTTLGLAVYYHVQCEDAYDEYNYTHREKDYSNYLNFYDKRANMLWWFGALKVLSVIDAYVDAKLYDYDSKKKIIEFKITPQSAGISYRF